MLQVMAYFAQTEREFIHQRQAEGISAAKAKGKHLGRNPLPLPENFETICNECHRGAITTRKAANMLNMCHSTFYRHYVAWSKKICMRYAIILFPVFIRI